MKITVKSVEDTFIYVMDHYAPIGKGNPEWNCSAPHGAGRIMSRTKAKDSLSMDEYRETI